MSLMANTKKKAKVLPRSPFWPQLQLYLDGWFDIISLTDKCCHSIATVPQIKRYLRC